jgi:hypothetical protein
MYVVSYTSEQQAPRLVCTSSLADAKVQSQGYYDEGFDSGVYLVATNEANVAIAAVQQEEGEMIWSPAPKVTPREQAKVNDRLLAYQLGIDDA